MRCGNFRKMLMKKAILRPPWGQTLPGSLGRDCPLSLICSTHCTEPAVCRKQNTLAAEKLQRHAKSALKDLLFVREQPTQSCPSTCGCDLGFFVVSANMLRYILSLSNLVMSSAEANYTVKKSYSLMLAVQWCHGAKRECCSEVASKTR